MKSKDCSTLYSKTILMKKLLLLLLLFAFILPAKGQNTFAPVGAEWWYSGRLWDYEYWDYYTQWADQMTSLKDTTVVNKPCRMLTATRHKKNQMYPDQSFISDRDTFFVYNNEDTVFCYDEKISDFTPLYIFNVQQGDTLCLRQPNSWIPNPEFCIVIDSVVTETYDNVQLKSYYNHTISGATVNWGMSFHHQDDWNKYEDRGKYTEKIGGNWENVGSFLPASLYHNPDYYKDNLLPTGKFRCYHDPETNIKMIDFACDSVMRPFLDIREMTEAETGIVLYPNPSSGQFTLEVLKPFKAGTTAVIRDVSGREMKSISVPSNSNTIKFELDGTPAGMYFLMLTTPESKYYQKIIIQH